MRVMLGITGASGAPYAARVLRALTAADAEVGLVAAAFCAISLVVGYVVPRAVGVVEGQAIACSMEIGLHNATLAIFVAVEVLDETAISVPAAVYSLFMFAFGVTWGLFVSRRVRTTAAA